MATGVEKIPDTAVANAVHELELAAELGDATRKTAALKLMRGLVNPFDDSYDAQKALATEGAVDVVVKLLDDNEEGVVCDAAIALRLLVAHSETVSVKLRHGREVGYGGRPDQVSFNPVQATLDECQGVRKLANHLFGNSSLVKDAVYDTLMAACSYNHENKLAFLRALVTSLLDGRTEAVALLDTLMAGLEMTEDVTVVLDQALMPVLKIVKEGEEADRMDAIVLLGTICEERPAAATFLVEEGLLEPLAQMIIGGDTLARDAAVHTMFQVIRRNKKVLQRGEEVLGVEGSSLVEPLIDVVQGPHPAEGQDDPEPRGFDSSDEAALVLKALAEQDPAARERVEELTREKPQLLEPTKSRCSIM